MSLLQLVQCVLTDDNIIQKHEPFSFCYVMVIPEGCEEPYLYRGPNAVRVFMKKMKEEILKKCVIFIKNPLLMIPLTEEEEDAFQSATVCHICQEK